MCKSNTDEYLVSVVIPAYKSDDTIRNTLTAITRQRCDFRYEIIVVNSSNDSTPAIINNDFPEVTLIQLETQTPSGDARNIGAERARGQYLLFLDSDCIVDDNWIGNYLRHFSDDYCALGGPVINGNPETSVSWAGYILEFSEFFPREDRIYIDSIPSCNLFLSKDTFSESGGFPSNYRYQQVDRLFCLNLRRLTGKRILFHPKMVVRHHHRDHFREFRIHQFKIGRGGAEILRLADLQWSWLIKRRLLVNLLLPILPLPKLIRSTMRTLRRIPAIMVKKPLIFPLLCLGMFYWLLGFGTQANQKDYTLRSN